MTHKTFYLLPILALWACDPTVPEPMDSGTDAGFDASTEDASVDTDSSVPVRYLCRSVNTCVPGTEYAGERVLALYGISVAESCLVSVDSYLDGQEVPENEAVVTRTCQGQTSEVISQTVCYSQVDMSTSDLLTLCVPEQ